MLNEDHITKYKIAKLAECSYPWVHEFIKVLEKKKLVKNTKVLRKEDLMNYWISLAEKSKYKDYLVQKPLEFLKKVKLEYALTTYQADNIVQHFLFPSRTDVYIRKEELDIWHKMLLDSGALYGKGNFRVLLSDDYIFYKSKNINEFKVVSLPQLIFDLKREGGVCEESAQMLLKRL